MTTISVNYNEIKSVKEDVYSAGLEILNKVQKDPLFTEIKYVNYQIYHYSNGNEWHEFEIRYDDRTIMVSDYEENHDA